MKYLYLLVTMGWGLMSLAQTQINKSIPVASGQKVNLHFDYPQLIKVSSWDKNEVLITGTVSINGGENDEAFKLTSNSSGREVNIKGEIPNIKDLPQRITVKHNGEKIVFKNKQEFEKFKKDHGVGFDMTSWGHDVDIVLDIKVPKGMATDIVSVYGIVELKDLQQSMELTATSTYGGVDAAINTTQVGELYATTDYGQIYSNLDIKFKGDGLVQRDFHTELMARPGKGPKYSFESKYGNVYLRKK